MLGCAPRLTAINHWPVAVDTHTRNHPEARHRCASLDALNPRELFAEGDLDLLWASPECTHHSSARGGRPVNDQSRATAWCVVRWAEALRPSIILVENVPEFLTWGGIGSDGRPLHGKKGATFLAWVGAMESLGYQVDWRVLCAADYGDPTTRHRLFVQAVRGRRKIVWPEPTHAPVGETDLLCSRMPWVAAREIIDWSLPGVSIFDRRRPLSAKTIARIEAGLNKFGLRAFIAAWDNQSSANGVWSVDAPLGTVVTKARHGVAEPFLVKLRGTCNGADIGQPVPTVTASGNNIGLAEPFLVQVAHGNHNGHDGNRCRARSIDEPMPTVCGRRGDVALCEPHLLPQHAGSISRPVSQPAPTVTCAGAIALVEPFLVKFYGTSSAASIDAPLDTVTVKDRFGLARPTLEIRGERYLLDVRFRMLQPHELQLAQGFRADYQFAGTKTEIVKQIGNAVPRRLARALVLAAWSQKARIADVLFGEPQEAAV